MWHTLPTVKIRHIIIEQWNNDLSDVQVGLGYRQTYLWLITLTWNKTGRIPQLLGDVFHEVTALYKVVANLTWEKDNLRQRAGHFEHECRILQADNMTIKHQLNCEGDKWYQRYINAIRDRTNAQCDACGYQFSKVHLAPCFHLVCKECYSVQSSTASTGKWMCRACACLP